MKKNVGMAEIKICQCPDELGILGLGSCVALALYHEKSQTGALAHIMLPEGVQRDGVKPGKYATTAVPKTIEKMKKKVGEKGRIVAKIVGGSQMFSITKTFGIGERNVSSVKDELRKHKIKIVAEDTGRNYGRNITFSTLDGTIKIKCVYGETEI